MPTLLTLKRVKGICAEQICSPHHPSKRSEGVINSLRCTLFTFPGQLFQVIGKVSPTLSSRGLPAARAGERLNHSLARRRRTLAAEVVATVRDRLRS
jgi:hypothetical protein